MSLFELILVAVGLSMDAFAVSICKGLSDGKVKPKHAVIAGVYFGGFQALMPFIGYFLGVSFKSLIQSFDHWIAFALLAIIGGNMIKESFGKEEEKLDASFSFKAMIILAVATSIDALAVGVSFAALPKIVSIWWAIAIIGVTTFIISFAGIYVGSFFGTKFKSKAELAGGIILVIIGAKILIEHLIENL